MVQSLSQQASSAASSTPISTATKNMARDLYLQGDKSQAAIAAQVGIHQKTLSYWIKQNKWQEIKNSVNMSPVIIRQNLYSQLEAFTEHILTREDGNCFPSYQEVLAQYKLVQAIFKFPNYTFEEVKQLYKELYPPDKNISANKTAPLDKDLTKNIDNQLSATQSLDKDGIKNDENNNPQIPVAKPVDTGYIPKRNIVLRSGVRWIEKDLVYDPSTKQNRKLRKPEWEELMKKGLTKADFQGWHPAC